MRRIVTGHYVDPDLAGLGLEGRNGRESIALLRQSELISERLGGDDLDELLGEPLFDLSLDPRPYVQQIESSIAELREAFEAHQRSRRRVDELLVRKKEAVKEYDTTFVRIARQFEDLCRLTDLDDLADKVRPSLTRRGQTAVEPEDGETPPEAISNGADGAEGDAGDVTGPPAESAAASVSAPEPAPEPGAEPEADPDTESTPAA